MRGLRNAIEQGTLDAFVEAYYRAQGIERIDYVEENS